MPRNDAVAAANLAKGMAEGWTFPDMVWDYGYAGEQQQKDGLPHQFHKSIDCDG